METVKAIEYLKQAKQVGGTSQSGVVGVNWVEVFDLAIEALKNSINDEIFLLSIEEYAKYKDVIPHINSWWWLRSPGSYSNRAVSVIDDGTVCANGGSVDCDSASVRPALNFTNLKSRITPSKKGEDYFMFNEFRWKIIDHEKNLAISEMPITFSKFDDKSNDYEHSYIRGWLLNWIKEAEE